MMDGTETVSHIDKPAKNMNPYSQNNVFLSDGIPRCFNLKQSLEAAIKFPTADIVATPFR